MLWWLVLACTAPTTPVDDKGDDTPAGDTDVTPPVDTDVPVDTDPGEQPAHSIRVRITDVPNEIVPVADDRGTIGGKVTTADFALEDLTFVVRSDRDGELPGPTIQPDGTFVWVTDVLSPGNHELTFVASAPDGTVGQASTELGVCEWPPLEDFNGGPPSQDWRLYGHATWDNRGWIEVTGNQQSRKGAIYRVSRKISPGDFRIEFKIATGGGINTGADGFAVNIINAADVRELESIIDAAAVGGCLAYGVTNGYCGNMTISAFHIEFDTWYNAEAQIRDPTQDNHMELTTNGDPGAHYLFAAIPSLEDLQWRHVRVQSRGAQLQAWLDGVLVINGQIPGFSFDGGYVGVSGSTGWATNYHRFDDLQLYDQCIVPEDDTAGP